MMQSDTKPMKPITGNRLEFIDALRGLTIILVVYSHLITHYSPVAAHSQLNQIFIGFRMPLFFFISGFFVFTLDYSAELFKKRAFNRIVRQLYPTVLMFALFCWCFMGSRFLRGVLHPGKYGYWFTLTAVELFFITTPLLLLLSRVKNIGRLRYNLCLLAYTALMQFILWTLFKNAGKIGNIAGVSQLYSYFLFFMGGVIFKYNFDTLHSIVVKKWFTLLAFVGFLVCFYFFKGFPNKVLYGFLAIAVLYGLAYGVFRSQRVIGSRCARGLCYLGKMTLEIYLLHYFVIYLLRTYTDRHWIVSHINAPWEFPMLFGISIAIALICLGTVYLLKRLRVYGIIFPQAKKKSAPKVFACES